MQTDVLGWLASADHPASRYLAALHLSTSPPAAVDDVDALCLDGKVTLVKKTAKQLMDPVPLEPIGEPSRLLTLQWLRVKRAFGLERT